MASTEGAGSLDRLVTEARRADADYDSRSTSELVELMNDEDASVPAAVAAVADELAAAIDAIVARLEPAGDSSTWAPARPAASRSSTPRNAKEPSPPRPARSWRSSPAKAFRRPSARRPRTTRDAGRRAVEELGVSADDAVVGVSASGRTPFVLAALEAAAAAGALTVALTAVEESELARAADHDLAVVVGPEFVTGSTRLKAGTAQKLVLNTISTVAMIRLGKTYGDLMVDVRSSNEKLAARARRVVRLATGVSDEEAERALAEADGSAKVAVVALLAGVDAPAARERLEQAGGHVQTALER